jgi:hypothetical protein
VVLVFLKGEESEMVMDRLASKKKLAAKVSQD